MRNTGHTGKSHVEDWFALLEMPRRPIINLDQLKAKFLDRSGEWHPDKAAPDRKEEAERKFARLNTAYNGLRQTRLRLNHLLELEGAAKPAHVQSAPLEVVEFFTPMAQLTGEVDEFLKEKRRAGSPLLQAQLFEQGLEWLDRVHALQARLRTAIGLLESRLPILNAAWELNQSRPLTELQQIAAALGFLERWHAQLEERAAQLTL